MDLPELFSEVWFFVLRIAVGLLELCQSSFREFGPATRINEPRADFTSTPRANGFMREHSVLQPHEISAGVEPMGRFGCAEVANLPTWRWIEDDNLAHQSVIAPIVWWPARSGTYSLEHPQLLAGPTSSSDPVRHRQERTAPLLGDPRA